MQNRGQTGMFDPSEARHTVSLIQAPPHVFKGEFCVITHSTCSKAAVESAACFRDGGQCRPYHPTHSMLDGSHKYRQERHSDRNLDSLWRHPGEDLPKNPCCFHR